VINSKKITELLRNGDKVNLQLAYKLAKAMGYHKEFYYLIKFGDLIEMLNSNEEIDLIDYNFRASEFEKIQNVESFLGMPLHDDIKKFYSQCNGFSLRWNFKNKPKYSSLSSDGMINILGVEEIYFENQIFSEGLDEIILHGRKLQIDEFDNYSHLFEDAGKYSVMAYSGPGFQDNPLLFLSDDSHSYFFDSRTIHITNYIELIFHSYGLANARAKLLRKRKGYMLPICNFDMNWFLEYPQPDLNKGTPIFYYPETKFYSGVEF
jgi:hypothetical protein